jgi:hypothetical protein
MAIEINDLAAFVSVARASGFRDAARKSGVSPSGLSTAIRRLEAKLGVRLRAWLFPLPRTLPTVLQLARMRS